MTDYSRIIDELGGTAELSREANVPYQTGAGWKRRNSIPPQYWPDVVNLARRKGLEITLEHLASLSQQARRSSSIRTN